MPEENDKVGEVSQSRYEQIVAELRDVVEQQTRGQFTIGDRALEIEPLRDRGGQGWTTRPRRRAARHARRPAGSSSAPC